MPDRLGVEKALELWRATGGAERRRNLRFIAAGASTDRPRDAARRAGEIAYEPRSSR